MGVFINNKPSGNKISVLNVTLSQDDKKENLELSELSGVDILSIDTVATDDQLHLVVVYRNKDV